MRLHRRQQKTDRIYGAQHQRTVDYVNYKNEHTMTTKDKSKRMEMKKQAMPTSEIKKNTSKAIRSKAEQNESSQEKVR